MHKTPLYSQVEFSHSALKIYTITVSCNTVQFLMKFLNADNIVLLHT